MLKNCHRFLAGVYKKAYLVRCNFWQSGKVMGRKKVVIIAMPEALSFDIMGAFRRFCAGRLLPAFQRK